VQNQKDGRQIAPSRSPLKDLSAYGEVGDLTAVSDGYGKSDAHLPRFFFGLLEDLRALTPLVYTHVNPYGAFNLNLNERLLIEPIPQKQKARR
jgi:hypothetical protein